MLLFRVANIFVCLAYFGVQGLSLPGVDKKLWSFEFISLSFTSSDENLFNITVDLVQISRGEYAISGTAMFNYDIDEGDNMIEALVYRRATSSSEYKITPFTMPTQTFVSYLNTFYKNLLMESLSKCSDLPVFKDKFEPPFVKKNYTLNNCRLSNDGMPPYMVDGFYLINITGTGDVDYNFQAVMHIEEEL